MTHVISDQGTNPNVARNGRQNFLTRGAYAAAVAVVAAGLGLAANIAHAVIGTGDNVPAATLLLPYFEVDLGNPNGSQTSFSVVNTSRTQTLAHVTLWTDYAVPSFAFDIYLGGRDVVDIDMRLLFTKGLLPATGPSIGTAGPLSFPHAALPGSCAGPLALPSPLSLLPAAAITHLQKAHTGLASVGFSGNCGGSAIGDNVARGYVTIDVTNNCSALFPTQAGYFAPGGTGIAANANILTGQYTFLNRTTKLSVTESLVAIEADGTNPLTSTKFGDTVPNPGTPPPATVTAPSASYTFYGRFTGGVTGNAADNRETLANAWTGRYINTGTFAGGTSITVWRDFDRVPGQEGQPFACATPPAQMPSGVTVMFDEQEHPFYPGGSPVPDSQPLPAFQPNVFPKATQRLATSTLNAAPTGAGYAYLKLGAAATFFTGNQQAHVSMQRMATGQFGGSVNGQQLANPADNFKPGALYSPPFSSF